MRSRATSGEQVALQRVADRIENAAPAPKLEVQLTEGAAEIRSSGRDSADNMALLADTLGTADFDLAVSMLKQIAELTRRDEGSPSENLNRALGMIRGISPRDTTEALLAIQMVAVHEATLVAASRLKRAETVSQ